MPSMPMLRLRYQAVGTSTARIAKIPMNVGARTVPEERIMLENTTANPNTTALHSTRCNRCCVIAMTDRSLRNILTIGPESR